MIQPTVHPTALHRLLAEMDALTAEQIAAAEVKDPVARREREIAVISEPLQRMFTLLTTKNARLHELVDQHRAQHEAVTDDAPLDRAEHDRIHGEIKVLGDDVECLNRLFWRSIHEHHPADPEASGHGIRAGWQVVDIYGARRGGNILELIFGDLFR